MHFALRLLRLWRPLVLIVLALLVLFGEGGVAWAQEGAAPKEGVQPQSMLVWIAVTSG